MKHYDYIFTGAGLSALMTVYKMALSGKFSEKSILLIDKDRKTTNDRTWCFWEKPNGNFESIVSKKWTNALFANAGFKRAMDLSPYAYKMIKGLDFYSFALTEISKHPNIAFTNENVHGFSESNNQVIVQTATERFSCNKLFNSIYFPELALSQNQYPVFQQHFIGWFIKCGSAAFNPGQATFMDFSVEQKGNTRFMYVLPTSQTEALVEYTLFSKDLLSDAEYENEIRAYIKKRGAGNYEIVDKERGSIPMTAYPFWKQNSRNVLNIGSAGGWTKASTGFTFKNSDKKTDALLTFLLSGKNLGKFHKRSRFWFYDLLLLDILSTSNELGNDIFSALFKKGNPALVLKFLDEETSLFEDLKVILKCPKALFLKAFFKRISVGFKSPKAL